MFRALTGRAIHEGRNPTDRLLQAMKDRAPSLSTVAPHVPMWVVGVVDKALSFDQNDRFTTAADMRLAVRSTFAQLKEEAERVRLPPGAEPVPSDAASREVSAMFDAMLEPSIIVDMSFGGGHEVEEPGQ
jgi:hypothetical protein